MIVKWMGDELCMWNGNDDQVCFYGGMVQLYAYLSNVLNSWLSFFQECCKILKIFFICIFLSFVVLMGKGFFVNGKIEADVYGFWLEKV